MPSADHMTVTCLPIPSNQVRTVAAVLLRRVFLQVEHKDLESEVEVGVLQGCRAELLLALQSETVAPVRRKICDAIAELARSSLGEGREREREGDSFAWGAVGRGEVGM